MFELKTISIYLIILPYSVSLLSDKNSEFFFQNRGVVFMLYTQVMLFSLLGLGAVCVLWGHVILAYIATYSRSKIIVWVTSMGLLVTLNMNRTVKLLVCIRMFAFGKNILAHFMYVLNTF